MVSIQREYVFTQHLKERFVQRTNKKYRHIDDCRQNCSVCRSLKEEIRSYIFNNHAEVMRGLISRLSLSEETKSYINNSQFMAWYYDKYGYDCRVEFRVHDDLLFVIMCNDGKKFVVTCMYSKLHFVGKNHRTKKFSKVKKTV